MNAVVFHHIHPAVSNHIQAISALPPTYNHFHPVFPPIFFTHIFHSLLSLGHFFFTFSGTLFMYSFYTFLHTFLWHFYDTFSAPGSALFCHGLPCHRLPLTGLNASVYTTLCPPYTPLLLWFLGPTLGWKRAKGTCQTHFFPSLFSDNLPMGAEFVSPQSIFATTSTFRIYLNRNLWQQKNFSDWYSSESISYRLTIKLGSSHYNPLINLPYSQSHHLALSRPSGCSLYR